MKKKLEGVGTDALIITNSKGGKQSASPMAMYLIDPGFLFDFLCKNTNTYNETLDDIVCFMENDDRSMLINAVKDLARDEKVDPIVEIGKVLQVGAEKYEPNNWRLIPQEEHINHALIHLYAHILGDEQDNHIGHCLCRLMMAYATEPTEGFSYIKYIGGNNETT